MWTVDQIKVRDGTVYFAFTKIGDYVQNPPEEVRVRVWVRVKVGVRVRFGVNSSAILK